VPTLAEQCSNPIHLWVQRLDTATGELGERREIVKACGTRRERICPSCSLVYQRDAFSVVRSGITSADGSQVPLTFLTLTAPGSKAFGKTHSRRTKWSKKKREWSHYGCECGKWHNEGDEILGQPIDPESYDYEGAAAWNAASSRLFTITLQRLARMVYGVDEKGKALGKLDYIRVAEFQRRGLIHYHCLVRADIDVRDFHALVRGGTRRDGQVVERVKHGEFVWGEQCDLKSVRPGAKFGVGAYLVKLVRYAIKSTADEPDNGGWMGYKMRRVAPKTCGCGTHWERPCDAAKGLPFDTKHREVCRRHRLSENGFGYRGHILTKSKAWGLTFRELRERREQFHGRAKTPTWASFTKAAATAAEHGQELVAPRYLTFWFREKNALLRL
jgi:hypothetical protein